MHKEILKDIGEKELINRLARFMPKNQVSDDCALIKTKNKNLLVNTDSLVEMFISMTLVFALKTLVGKQLLATSLTYYPVAVRKL